MVAVTPAVYRAELAADRTLTTRLEDYHRARAALPPHGADGAVYPQVVMLGTGSSIPNKKRNTSGILVNLRWVKCWCWLCRCGGVCAGDVGGSGGGGGDFEVGMSTCGIGGTAVQRGETGLERRDKCQ